MSETTPEPVADLDINEVDDGLVIFDPATERVHYLNGTAALVFTLCTGEHDAEAIADLVRRIFQLAEPPAPEVDVCLGQLRREGLIR
ncbi:MAG: PqqD family protein [Solirubrobacteraceae bacterium]